MAREKAGAGTLLDPAAGGSSDEKRENGKTSRTRRVAAQVLDRLLASIILRPAFLMALPCMLAEFRRLVNPCRRIRHEQSDPDSAIIDASPKGRLS
jgi:hypothetical protein